MDVCFNKTRRKHQTMCGIDYYQKMCNSNFNQETMSKYYILLILFVILNIVSHNEPCANSKDVNCDPAACPIGKAFGENGKCEPCSGNTVAIKSICTPCPVGQYQINGTCQMCHSICRNADNETFIDSIPESCYQVSYCKKQLKMFIKGRCPPGLVLDLKLGNCEYCSYACDEYDRIKVGHLCDKECTIESCPEGFYKRIHEIGAPERKKKTDRTLYCASCKNLCQLEKDKERFELELDCHLREECSELYRDIVSNSCPANELYDLISGACRTCEEMCIFDKHKGMEEVCNKSCSVIFGMYTNNQNPFRYSIPIAMFITIFLLIVTIICMVIFRIRILQKRHLERHANLAHIEDPIYPIEEEHASVDGLSLLMYIRNNTHDTNHPCVNDDMLDNIADIDTTNETSLCTKQMLQVESNDIATNPNVLTPLAQDKPMCNQGIVSTERNLEGHDVDNLRQSEKYLSYDDASDTLDNSAKAQMLSAQPEPLSRNAITSQLLSFARQSQSGNNSMLKCPKSKEVKTEAPNLDDIINRLKLWPYFRYIDYSDSAMVIIYDQCDEDKAQQDIHRITRLPHGTFSVKQMSETSSINSGISRRTPSVNTTASLYSYRGQSDIASCASIRSSLTHTSEYNFVETIYDKADLHASLTSDKSGQHIKGPDELGHKTNDEIEYLPRNVSEISNVENKLQMLAKQGWVRRLVCNGRYIRVWYDAIDEPNAKRLVADILGIENKHFDCEYIETKVGADAESSYQGPRPLKYFDPGGKAGNLGGKDDHTGGKYLNKHTGGQGPYN